MTWMDFNENGLDGGPADNKVVPEMIVSSKTVEKK
jgi:hypothetical protein